MSTEIMNIENLSQLSLPDWGDDYASDLNSSLAGFAARNQISTRGQLFTLNRADGTVINCDTDYLNVVIIAANPNNSKSYFGRAYDPNAEDQSPVCSAVNGKIADTHLQEKAAAAGASLVCATCQFNVKGSGSDGKSKACGDRKHIAVLTELDEGIPYAMNLSVTAKIGLQNHVASIEQLAKVKGVKNIPLEFVTTKLYWIKRDPKTGEPYQVPRLGFSPVGFVGQQTIKVIKELTQNPEVKRLVYMDDEALASQAQGLPHLAQPHAPVQGFNAPGVAPVMPAGFIANPINVQPATHQQSVQPPQSQPHATPTQQTAAEKVKAKMAQAKQAGGFAL